jgi:aminoglycoside phosphotransferase (APT) family kinase protein
VPPHQQSEPAPLLAAINRRHGVSLTLAGRAPGGESGSAWIVEGPGGARYLLKADSGSEFRIDDAIAITSCLRERGYPLPAYRFSGRDGETRYIVRELIAGEPMQLSGKHVARLLELNDLQTDAAAGIATDWPAAIIESVLNGFRDWCVLDTLRYHSAETAAMLAKLQALVQANAAGTYRTTDAVHFDFNTANILVDGDRIAGVIDWEGARAGDRAFDIATLLFYHHGDVAVRRLLWQRALAIASRGAMVLYLAHMIVRQVDWSIRRHSAEVADVYIAAARIVMNEIRA